VRVVVSHENFDAFGGTESYMLAVVEQLMRTGHDVWVHAQTLGAMAAFAHSRGVRVVDRLALPPHCDLVLAQDAATCLEMWERYPDAVRIFVGHSQEFALQAPPQIAGSYQALVVLSERGERWADGLAWRPRLVRLRQPVDLDRFRLPAAGDAATTRVLVLSNYPFGSRAKVVSDACAAAECELRWVGRAHGPTPTPEAEIALSDIVIGLGRSVLDAMAAARAPFVFGPLGGDGWVTADSYEALERDGFSGRATARAIDAEVLSQALREWRPQMGIACRDLASRHHDVRHHVRELVVLARELGLPETPPSGVERELARLVRLEWQRSSAVYSLRQDNASLRAELAERDAVAGRLRAEVAQRDAVAAELRAEVAQRDVVAAEMRAELERARLAAEEVAATMRAFRATRRYRVAGTLARPLDALRARAHAVRGARRQAGP